MPYYNIGYDDAGADNKNIMDRQIGLYPINSNCIIH